MTLFHFKDSLLFLRNLYFCPDFLGHVGKWLNSKPEVNFKIYDFAT